MRIDITTDAARFLDDVDPLLRGDPLRHKVIANAPVNRIEGRSGAMVTEFLSVRDSAGTVVGIAQCTNGAVYLGEQPGHSISAVADAFRSRGIVLRGVEGDNADAAAFAARWSAVSSRCATSRTTH